MAYTEVDSKAAAAILKSAGCAALSAVESISGGWANSNYLLELEDGTRLVLKIWDERSPTQVNRLNSHLELIASHGVPTPVPLLLDREHRMIEVERTGWLMLHYVDVPGLPGDSPAMKTLA